MKTTSKIKMNSKMRTFSKIKITPKTEQHYLKKLLMTPHLARHSKTDTNPEILSAVLTGNSI